MLACGFPSQSEFKSGDINHSANGAGGQPRVERYLSDGNLFSKINFLILLISFTVLQEKFFQAASIQTASVVVPLLPFDLQALATT
jgi:hypothetical protein